MAPVCTSCIISSPGWHQHAPCKTQRFTAQAFNKTDLGFYLAQETFQRTGNRKGGAAMIRSAVETAVVPHWNGQLGFNVVCLRYLYLFICCYSFLKPSWPFQQTSYVLYFTVVPLCVAFVVVLIVTVRFQRCVASIPSQIPGSVAMPRHRHGVTGRLTVFSSW